MLRLINIRNVSFLSLLLLVISCTAKNVDTDTSSILAPHMLKVGEGFVNPVGYYESSPRFSWQISAKAEAKSQSAYQIQVASSIQTLGQSLGLWDSKKTLSSETSWVNYQGAELTSREKAFWRVRFWDENDHVSDWSEINTFELGLLYNQDWQAKWIGHPATDISHSQPKTSTLATAQYLRKTFVAKKDIQQARLYITAKGLFEPYLNGNKVGDYVMTPGWTPYAKRIETLTFDVTDSIKTGENALAASIAGGWYAGRVYELYEQDNKLPARLLAQLEITYLNGEKDVIVSDDSWHASQNGPIRFSSNYDGEQYNQAYEIPGWNTVDFNDSDWVNTLAEPLESKVKLKPKRHTPVINASVMPAIELVSVKNGKAIFDLGQNMVGVPQISIPVIKDQQVTIRYAEALNMGEFYTDNYRSAKSTNHYLPNKSGNITYKPTFTFHGFRYIELSGYDASKAPDLNWVKGYVQHSDFNIHANFKSSSAKLNKLADNIVWGLRGNFLDIPTDCPQRDERMGWTGDAQVFATPSMYMADVYGFWAAWLESMREEQKEDGMIPLYIPFVDWLNFESSGWGDAATVIPWELYVMTGDKTILADNYDMMKKWIDFHRSKSKKHVSSMGTFGDWLQPYPQTETPGEGGNRGDTNFSLIGTAYHARSIELTLKSAKVLGKAKDVEALSEHYTEVKQAFRAEFFDDQLNLKSGIPTQTSYLLPIEFDLFSELENKVAEKKVLALISDANNHLRTGFLGTPLLTSVLQSAGESDVMYDLLFKESYPSWFYSINNGATTTWERWNSYSIEDGFNSEGMNSLNHYAYGTVSRWFYEGILGITPSEAGFKRIRIEPQFNQKLTTASGYYDTPQGKVAVEWRINNSQLVMAVTIPKNTTADIVLPAESASEVTINGRLQEHSNITNLAPGEYKINASIVLH